MNPTVKYHFSSIEGAYALEGLSPQRRPGSETFLNLAQVVELYHLGWNSQVHTILFLVSLCIYSKATITYVPGLATYSLSLYGAIVLSIAIFPGC